MKFSVQVIVVASLWAMPVGAQNLTVDMSDVVACFDNTPVGAQDPGCLGAGANACQDGDGGSTTAGMATCIGAETQIWDDLLNESYAKLQERFETRPANGMDASPVALKTALRDAQRAWIAFRDADCGLLYTLYQGGTIRSIVSANCHMTMTASRALALRDMDQP